MVHVSLGPCRPLRFQNKNIDPLLIHRCTLHWCSRSSPFWCISAHFRLWSISSTVWILRLACISLHAKSFQYPVSVSGCHEYMYYGFHTWKREDYCVVEFGDQNEHTRMASENGWIQPGMTYHIKALQLWLQQLHTVMAVFRRRNVSRFCAIAHEHVYLQFKILTVSQP